MLLLCELCYKSLDKEYENLTISNWLDEKCVICHNYIGEYCLDAGSILGRAGTVFLDGQGQPVLIKEDRGSVWFFIWANNHWIPWKMLSDLSLIFEIPDNLDSEQQEFYQSLHRRWLSENHDKTEKDTEVIDDKHPKHWFVGENTHTVYEPTMYGVWINDDWMILGDGSIFHTFYMRVAKAERNRARKWRKEAGITDEEVEVAIIDADGNPRFLKG